MDRMIKNTGYQLLSGVAICTALDLVFLKSSGIGSMGQAIQVFLEIGGQVVALLVLQNSFNKLVRISSNNNRVMDMMPAMLAGMGFQPNLMNKISALQDYLLNSYSSFQMIQTVGVNPTRIPQRPGSTIVQEAENPADMPH